MAMKYENMAMKYENMAIHLCRLRGFKLWHKDEEILSFWQKVCSYINIIKAFDININIPRSKEEQHYQQSSRKPVLSTNFISASRESQ